MKKIKTVTEKEKTYRLEEIKKDTNQSHKVSILFGYSFKLVVGREGGHR